MAKHIDAELKERLEECLNEALEADDPTDTHYHVREALQLIETEEVDES